jgi:hypothetical protein
VVSFMSNRFTPRERTPTTLRIGGWVGPRDGLDAGVRRKIPSRIPFKCGIRFVTLETTVRLIIVRIFTYSCSDPILYPVYFSGLRSETPCICVRQGQICLYFTSCMTSRFENFHTFHLSFVDEYRPNEICPLTL